MDFEESIFNLKNFKNFQFRKFQILQFGKLEIP